jgi:hypothetical protein
MGRRWSSRIELRFSRALCIAGAHEESIRQTVSAPLMLGLLTYPGKLLEPGSHAGAA